MSGTALCSTVPLTGTWFKRSATEGLLLAAESSQSEAAASSRGTEKQLPLLKAVPKAGEHVADCIFGRDKLFLPKPEGRLLGLPENEPPFMGLTKGD